MKLTWTPRPDLRGSVWESMVDGVHLTVRRADKARPPRKAKMWHGLDFIGRADGVIITRGKTPMQVMSDLGSAVAALKAAA